MRVLLNTSFLSKITQSTSQAFMKQDEMNTQIKKMMKLIQFNKSSSHFEKTVRKFTIIFTSIIKTFHKIKASAKTEVYTKTLNIISVINKMSLLCQGDRARQFTKQKADLKAIRSKKHERSVKKI